jgi:predicted anti-sigma-YlaC factor YlaD
MTNHYTDDILIDYLHGELTPADDARLHEHLLVCETCRAAYESEARLGDWLRQAARDEERDLPAMVRARVWEAVRHERPTFGERLRAAFRPALTLPLGVAMAALVFVVYPTVHQPEAVPTVAASYYLDEHAAEGQANPLADHPVNAATVVTASDTTSTDTTPDDADTDAGDHAAGP